MRTFLLFILIVLAGFASAYETAWVSSFNGPGLGLDEAWHIRIDGDGNPYVLGPSLGTGGKNAVALNKYTKAGALSWQHRIEATNEGYEDPYLAQDGLGNFYIACTRRTNNGANRTIFLRKVNSAGTTIWSREFLTTGHIQDVARGLTIDAAGNTYTLSQPIEQYSIPGGSATTQNIAVTSYDGNGTFRWRHIYRGFDTNFNAQQDWARAIRLDSQTNVLVCGETDIGGTVETDVVTFKTTSGGSHQWTKRYEGQGGFFDGNSSSITSDSANNVIVTGWMRFDQFDDLDILTLKYDPAGTLIWWRNYDGPQANADRGFKVTVDAADNVLVAGQACMIANRGLDAIVMKYAPNGNAFNPFTYSGGTGSNDERFLDVFVDATGTIHAGGAIGFQNETRLFAGWCRFISGGGFNFAAHAYQSVGDAICYDIGLGPNGDIYMAGRAADDMLIAREIQDPVAVTNVYSAVQDTPLTVPAPGVIGNDFFTEGATAGVVTNVAHGTLSLNANGGFTYTPTTGFTGTDSFTYKLSKQGPTLLMTSNIATVTLNVGGQLQNLTVVPNSFPGGVKPTGTITLGLAAPAAGATITLSSTNPALASVPANIVIPQGSSSGTFQVTTVPPSADANVTISASYKGTTKTAPITIKPIDLVNFYLQPTAVIGGDSLVGVVLISYPAPAGGKVIALSDNTSAISEPATVTIPAGLRSANFPITTTKLSATAIREVYATLSTKRTARLTIYRTPRLATFALAPTTVKGGSPSTGTVTMDIAAPLALKVNLADNSSALTTPAFVEVANGATQGTFTVATSKVTSTVTRAVTASYQGVSKTAFLTLTP